MSPLALVYFGNFFFLGTNTAFAASWLTGRALDPAAIALVSATTLIARTLGQPVMGLGGDLFGRRAMLMICALGAVAATTALALSTSPAAILPLAALAGLFTGPIIPLADAVALSDRTIHYGRARLWGSISYAVAILIGGFVIDHTGPSLIIWFDVAGLAILGVAALMLPRGAVSSRLLVWPALKAELARPLLWLFMATLAALNAAHGFYYLFSVKHWHEVQGLSFTTTGMLWVVAIGAEVTLMAWLGGGARRGTALALLAAAGLASLVRYTALAFEPPLAALFPLQMLHALGFGAMHLGAMAVIRLAVADTAFTGVMGVYAALVNGVGIGVVTATLGPVYEAYGARGYLISSGLALLGLVGTLAIWRLWSGGLFAQAAPSAEPSR